MGWIIHGYHGKRILKNYIQSDGFIKEMEREGYQMKRMENSNHGVSCFFLIWYDNIKKLRLKRLLLDLKRMSYAYGKYIYINFEIIYRETYKLIKQFHVL